VEYIGQCLRSFLFNVIGQVMSLRCEPYTIPGSVRERSKKIKRRRKQDLDENEPMIS